MSAYELLMVAVKIARLIYEIRKNRKVLRNRKVRKHKRSKKK